MKILMGHFTLESNEHVEGLTELDSFNIKFGEDLIQEMEVADIFRDNNIEIIPAIYANGHTATVLSSESYEYIHSKMIRCVKENLSKIDGIYLFLHGASKVENLSEGAGERQLLSDIRKIVGPYLPICVVMDPHGNLTEDYVSDMTIARCYRESPHTDMVETKRKTARMFVKLLNNKKSIKPQYRKLPFVLGGERSVSTDEPMLSINKKLNEIEKSPKILSASFHVGYLRHDNYAVGSGLIVVPSDNKYIAYAQKVLDEMYDYCVNNYNKFDYHGNTLEVSEAIKKSINEKYHHIVITDSGDNVTSGGMGDNTTLLRQYLALENYNGKKILFSGITDNHLFHAINQKEDNKYFEVEIGTNRNELSKAIKLSVKIIARGKLQQIFGDTSNFGETITLSVEEKPIDIILINNSVSFAEMHQFEAANVCIEDYNIIVVKQGYIFPELKEFCDYSIMVLTDGPTNQKTEKLVFKQIARPMMPFDELT